MVRAAPVPVRQGDGERNVGQSHCHYGRAGYASQRNRLPVARGLRRLEEVPRPAAMAGVALSHSR